MNESTNFFSTRQHKAYMLSALYAIVRPSVRQSHGWIIHKRLKIWDHEIFTIR